MGHTYIRLDFGTDEEKAQQARHKLDGWRQAFRLDKKLQYKLDRPESPEAEGEKPAAAESSPKAAAAEKSKGAGKSKEKEAAKAKASAGGAKAKTSESAEQKPAETNGKVGLLVRLYFSSHEKLSEQRWIERIPMEEPFKGASPRVIHSNDAEFEKTDQQFETMEKKTVKYP